MFFFLKWKKAPQKLTISPPCTPLPRRLGAYSARSTERSHSITRWLVHWVTSEGVTLFCKQEGQAGKEMSQISCIPAPVFTETYFREKTLFLDCYLAARAVWGWVWAGGRGLSGHLVLVLCTRVICHFYQQR